MIISAEDLRRAPSREAENLPYRASCSVAGITLALRTDSEPLASEFLEYYRDQELKEGPTFVFSVSSTAFGYRFTCARGSFEWTRGSLPIDALMFLVDAAAVSSLIDSEPALTSFHAAAISWNGRAAAISGDSHAGKTTTLLACARGGCKVYTDERVILKEGFMQPFLRSSSIRSGGMRLLLDDRNDDRLATEIVQGGRVSLRRAFGSDVVAAPAPLSHVFVIAGKTGVASTRPISRMEALSGISKWFRSHGNGFDRLGAALTLLKSVRSYALTLGSVRETAEAIMACMDER